MLQTTINTRKISLGSALSEYSGETELDIGTASVYSSTIISNGVQADALAATRSGVTPIPPTGSPRLSLNPKNSEKLVHGHLRALRHGEMAWSVRLARSALAQTAAGPTSDVMHANGVCHDCRTR